MKDFIYFQRLRERDDDNEEPLDLWLKPAHIAAILVNDDYHTVIILANGLQYRVNADAQDVGEGKYTGTWETFTPPI